MTVLASAVTGVGGINAGIFSTTSTGTQGSAAVAATAAAASLIGMKQTPPSTSQQQHPSVQGTALFPGFQIKKERSGVVGGVPIVGSFSGNNQSSSTTTTGSSGGVGGVVVGSNAGNSGGWGGAYTCERCGNSYARPHSLNRHVRFECGVEPQFECPICHKKSKHKHNLVLHMRTHQNR